MRRLMTSLAALLLAAPAFGATLDSAPALGAFADSHLTCLIRNISTATRTVKFQVLNYAGDMVYDAGVETILPGQLRFLAQNEDSMPLAASCRFVVSGSAKYFRAATIYDGANIEMVIPAE